MSNNTFDKKSSSNSEEHKGNGHAVNQVMDGGDGSRRLPLKGTYVPNDTESVDVFRLLDQLEELPEKAKNLPLKMLYGFDHEKFYYLVLKIRANLPEDMKKAQKIARESERIVGAAKDQAELQLESIRMQANSLIDDAKREAELIVDQAKRKAAEMLEANELARLATEQANEIIRNAETESKEIRKGADDYAGDVLNSLDSPVQKVLSGVKKSQEMFESSRR